MDQSQATKLLLKPDGSETLLLRRAQLSVIRGPDRGLALTLDRPRVRVGSGADCELRLGDTAVSRHHFELQATEAGYLLRDLGSTNGTLADGVRVLRALLTGDTTLELGQTALRLRPTDKVIELPLSRRGQLGGLLGRSAAMRRVFAMLEAAAPSDSTVLLQGESGTGKEVAAEAIHSLSARGEGPLVVVDCGAIPAGLMESELFGHQRGAFSGADRARAGALEQAHRGTLFLDEVGELPLELQPRLLRFLESGQVKRLGATRHRQVDARVVAATNRLLPNEVQEGRFRQDLYYRLAVVCVELPPLRDRPEDVLLLAHHFAGSFTADPTELITDELAGLLAAYHWPGNARELRNVVERMAVAPELGLASLRQDHGASPQSIGALEDLPFHEARRRWQDAFERQYLGRALERAGGVVSRAADEAGLPRQTMHRLLKQHGLR